MEKTIWSDIIIAGLATAVNMLAIIFETKKLKKDKINENRLLTYIECYELLERNSLYPNIVFNYNEYIDNLIKIKAKMKLFASNSVLQSFKAYYDWAIKIYEDYHDFCEKNDPEKNVHMGISPDGKKCEVPDYDENDLNHYEYIKNNYIDEKNIKSITVKSKIRDVLNAMRSDIGNDVFKDELFGSLTE